MLVVNIFATPVLAAGSYVTVNNERIAVIDVTPIAQGVCSFGRGNSSGTAIFTLESGNWYPNFAINIKGSSSAVISCKIYNSLGVCIKTMADVYASGVSHAESYNAYLAAGTYTAVFTADTTTPQFTAYITVYD